MPTLVVYLQEVTKDPPARRGGRMIAGAAAGTAVHPVAVPPPVSAPHSGDPETRRLLLLSLGRIAHHLPPPRLRPPTPRYRPVRGGETTRPRAGR